MKIYKTIKLMSIAGLLCAISCNKVTEDNNLVPLKIQIGEISQTRSIITGTSLPENSQYGIRICNPNFYFSEENVRVYYAKGVSTLEKDIYLTRDENLYVFAYYPYVTQWDSGYWGNNYMDIEADSQTDYLWGGYMTDKGEMLTVNADNPTAVIHFNHVMSRVTFRISKTSDVKDEYKLPSAYLRNVLATAYLNLLTGVVLEARNYTDIAVKISPDYVLSDEKDVIIADFLVIPSSAGNQDNVVLDFSHEVPGLKVNVPGPSSSGQQYTYNVTIDQQNKMSITLAEITPWNNNEEHPIVVGNNNYIE